MEQNHIIPPEVATEFRAKCDCVEKLKYDAKAARQIYLVYEREIRAINDTLRTQSMTATDLRAIKQRSADLLHQMDLLLARITEIHREIDELTDALVEMAKASGIDPACMSSDDEEEEEEEEEEESKVDGAYVMHGLRLMREGIEELAGELRPIITKKRSGGALTEQEVKRASEIAMEGFQLVQCGNMLIEIFGLCKECGHAAAMRAMLASWPTPEDVARMLTVSA